MRRRSGVIAAVALLALAGCADPVEEAEVPVDEAETDPPPDGPVTLRVTGDGWPRANIRYTAADETSQIEKVDLPWETELEYDSDSTLWLFVTYAHVPDAGSSKGSTLTCEILVGGEVVDEVEAESRPNDDDTALMQGNAVCSYTPQQR